MTHRQRIEATLNDRAKEMFNSGRSYDEFSRWAVRYADLRICDIFFAMDASRKAWTLQLVAAP